MDSFTIRVLIMIPCTSVLEAGLEPAQPIKAKGF